MKDPLNQEPLLPFDETPPLSTSPVIEETDPTLNTEPLVEVPNPLTVDESRNETEHISESHGLSTEQVRNNKKRREELFQALRNAVSQPTSPENTPGAPDTKYGHDESLDHIQSIPIDARRGDYTVDTEIRHGDWDTDSPPPSPPETV